MKNKTKQFNDDKKIILSTGIDLLDSIAGGGFRTGSLIKEHFESTYPINPGNRSHIVQKIIETDKGFNIDIKTLDTKSGKLLEKLIQLKKVRPFFRGKEIVQKNFIKEINLISIDIGRK